MPQPQLAMLLVKRGLIIIVNLLHHIHLLLYLFYLLLVLRTHLNYPPFPFLPLSPLSLHILSPTSSPIPPSVTPMPTDTMTGVKDLFSSMYRFPRNAAPTITLGDNSTIHAAGWGILDHIENTHRIRRIGLFVPQLHSTTLISISRHVQYADRSFHAENNRAILTYPQHPPSLSSFILQ